MKNSELERLINDKLNSATFSDYGPNGLQVEGREEVQKIITGVTASQALLDEAARREVTIIEDLDVLTSFEAWVLPEISRNIACYDRLYLTIDLDVLPAREMPAVSAPAALGIPLATLLRIVEPLCRSGKLQAVDLVEFNPQYDIDSQGARAAARLAWQIAHWWQ